jgi:putative transposase
MFIICGAYSKGGYGRIVTDRLRFCGAALKDFVRGEDREIGCFFDNHAVNSHPPSRRRERAMLRFRRVRTLRMFHSVHASIHNHFATKRHLQNRNTYGRTRASALGEWRGLLAARPRYGVGEGD